jgi:hypothetical protein
LTFYRFAKGRIIVNNMDEPRQFNPAAYCSGSRRKSATPRHPSGLFSNERSGIRVNRPSGKGGARKTGPSVSVVRVL